MLEQMIAADDELMLDTPFLRRIREEGREEGREDGQRSTLRRNILDAVQVRWHPSEAVLHQVEARLAGIAEESRLHHLFLTALQADHLDAFLAALEPLNG